MKYNKIVLNVPHSSIERCYEGWKGSLNMFPTIKRMTDWHTDILFNDENTVMIRFPFSRFYCDAERLMDDPLEKEGQGIIYKEYDGFVRELTVPMEKDIKYWYHVHISRLSNVIEDNTIVIDCHSFPSDLSGIDICIGYNNDESKPDEETIDAVCSIFEKEGYSVGINSPYSNSITPKDFDTNYHSIMIEVNKRVYMDEDTLKPFPDHFFHLKRTIKKVYEYLLKNDENQ